MKITVVVSDSRWRSSLYTWFMYSSSCILAFSVCFSSEYVNPYIPTQTPEENWSDHMQSPGWQPLCVWPNVWSGDLQVLKKYGHTWHRMSSLGPGVIKQHKPNHLLQTDQPLCGIVFNHSLLLELALYTVSSPRERMQQLVPIILSIFVPPSTH